MTDISAGKYLTVSADSKVYRVAYKASIPALRIVANDSGVQTMSSLDIVDYINHIRKPGSAILRHDSFMDKVPKVLGENASPKFIGEAKYGFGSNNSQATRKVYNFPRKEAIRMAMSYSYDLQAAVLDAWDEADMPVAAQAEVVGVQDKPINSVADIGIETGSIAAGDVIQTVNARKLHSFLQVGKDFSTWIKDKIEKYGFAENVDFVALNSAPQNGGAVSNGGQNRIEYHLSLDMAKEIAMVEKSEKGKEARNYFIQCEKKKKAVLTPVALGLPNFTDPIEAAKAWIAAEEGRKAVTLQLTTTSAELEAAKPKVEVYDHIVEADGLIDMGAAAGMIAGDEFKKLLAVQKLTFRANRQLEARKATGNASRIDFKAPPSTRNRQGYTRVAGWHENCLQAR